MVADRSLSSSVLFYACTRTRTYGRTRAYACCTNKAQESGGHVQTRESPVGFIHCLRLRERSRARTHARTHARTDLACIVAAAVKSFWWSRRPAAAGSSGCGRIGHRQSFSPPFFSTHSYSRQLQAHELKRRGRKYLIKLAT